ncbi:hypothetical protein [Caulobacter segnis]
MHPYARLTPGPGFDAHRMLLYYAQRLITFRPARAVVSRCISAVLRLAHGREAVRPDTQCAQAVKDLEAYGLAELAPLASTAAVSKMFGYFIEKPVVAPDGSRMLVGDLPAETASASYDLATIIGCPGLVELVNSPAVLKIASAYLHCRPTLSSLGVRWSLPNAGSAALFQSFHRDIDDWRFLKLFIYLTDVTETSGPHGYVRTSHRSTFGFRERRYEISEVGAMFGLDKLQTITGPAGTTFVADTLGIHRGGVPTGSARLILQAQYSLLPIYAFQYAPLDVRTAPIDPYSNRLMVRPVRGKGRGGVSRA